MRSTNAPLLSLRAALLLDAAASGVMGLLLLVAAAPLAPLLGLPISLLRGAGVVLVPFAALLVWLAGRVERNVTNATRALTWIVVAGNVLWALDSLLLLLTDWVSPGVLGQAFVIAQAVAVCAFTYLEITGLRALPASARMSRAA